MNFMLKDNGLSELIEVGPCLFIYRSIYTPTACASYNKLPHLRFVVMENFYYFLYEFSYL